MLTVFEILNGQRRSPPVDRAEAGEGWDVVVAATNLFRIRPGFR